jgi:hypothetical protein
VEVTGSVHRSHKESVLLTNCEFSFVRLVKGCFSGKNKEKNGAILTPLAYFLFPGILIDLFLRDTLVPSSLIMCQPESVTDARFLPGDIEKTQGFNPTRALDSNPIQFNAVQPTQI